MTQIKDNQSVTDLNNANSKSDELVVQDKETTLKKINQDERYLYYEGEITVSGVYYMYEPQTLLGGILCFRADEDTGYLIPREPDLYGEGMGDTRNPWFCFKNQDQAKKMFDLKMQEIFDDLEVECIQGEATVKVSNYIVDSLEAAVFDTAKLEEVVFKETYSTQCKQ